MNRKPIAVVGGVIANRYLNGGATWTRLNWVLGFKRLGFEVYFLEQISEADCLNGEDSHGFLDSYNRQYFHSVTRDFGLADSAALVCDNGNQVFGMNRDQLADLARDMDLLVNISGHVKLPDFMASQACKTYIDLDPGFTQLWYEQGLLGPEFIRHDRFYTIGEAIGSPGCPIPTGEIAWNTTRQPVVLEEWPVSTAGNPERFTTVANWRDDLGTLIHDDRMLGLKVHEFRRIIDLPHHVPQICEIALNIYEEDRSDLDRLREHGWIVTRPDKIVPDPESFRAYVQGSGAEFSVAKGIYSQTRSGWFSDRTVRYLASGKPALVQETGFSDFIPLGEGLLAFSSMDEAIKSAHDMSDHYSEHCRAARKLAEEHFDSDIVLGRLVEEIGIYP